MGEHKMATYYFGTGLASYKYGLSAGLPLDYFSYLCDAMFEGKKNGCQEIIQEITDSYDKDEPSLEMQNLARQQSQIITSFMNMMKPTISLKIMYASEIRKQSGFAACYERLSRRAVSPDIEIPGDVRDYVLLQSASLSYVKKELGVVGKLGWVVDPKKPGRGLDEYTFNQYYLLLSGDNDFDFSYVSAVSGPNGDRNSPYFIKDTDISFGRRMISVAKNQIPIEKMRSGNKAQKKYAEFIEGCFVKIDKLCEEGIFQERPEWLLEKDIDKKTDLFINNLFAYQQMAI
jgi:hypothetical protein